MNTKLMCATAIACAALELIAMPTEKEIRLAEPVVRRQLAAERGALRAGIKTRAEVAQAAMKLADKANSEAEKLLLMKGAFDFYVRAGEFDKAIDTLEVMQQAIPDMPDEIVLSIIKSSLRNVPRGRSNALYALLDDIEARGRNANGSANGAAKVNYKFSYKLEDGMAVLTGIFPKPVGTLVVPDEIDGYVVTRIEGPFWGCDKLTKVVLPAWLKFGSCDGGEFISCKSLASIEVAEANEELTSRDGALYSKDLSTLCVYPKTRETVELPPETKKVKVCAFRGCALKTAKIPEGVEEIERWNLCECPNLELIEFPKSLKSLGACAACGNDKLTKIVFYGDAPRADVAHYTSGLTQEVFTGAPENLVVEVRRGSKGWLGPDTIELPELWPTDQKESRPIRYMGGEVMRPMFSGMFPGWQVCPEAGREIGIVSNHRGQDDVAFVHPISPERPAVVSNTLTLSNGNPCLFLKMASFAKDYDFLLSVLVNGKEVLPKQLICTPDSEPWQDITIPLFAWRGEKVKIDVVLAANNWYCEHPFFKRLEVAEGTGQEKLDSKLEYDAKETVNGYTWSYRVKNGEAMIVAEKDGNHSCAVSPAPKGDVNIPATLGGVKVTGIGEEAFRFCNDLTSVTVPEGVTHIDTHALAYCRGLQSVTLPSSLRYIGYAAFGKDAELKSVTIPNGVKSIAADAFNGCGLKSVIIPESVMHIGDRAFCECGALEAVAISAGVASIGKGVFGGCNALKLITVDSGNQAFTSIDGVLYTKDRSELVMWPNPPKLVVIPDGVTKIRGWAFAGGIGMTSVTIPESVTSIDEIAFLACHGLKSITIPSRVKSIGVHAFEGCRELTEMTMLGERPEAKDLFPGCGKLKAIHVPANAKSWAGMKDWFGIPLVFDAEDAGHQTQTETTEPRASLLNRRRSVRESLSLRERREERQRRDAELRALEEKRRQREAEQRAQEEERRQREAERTEQRRQLVQLREELARQRAEQTAEQNRQATVNGYTWSYRVNNGEAMIVAKKDGKLSRVASSMPTGDVSIPATLNGVTVTSIDKDAFHSCNNLTGVTMPDSVASIGENAFHGCSNLKSTVLPKYLTIISNGMFNWCTSLTDVTIPDPVTSIGDGAFFRCAFTDITIPNTVTNIGTFAFGWCTELKSVNIPDSVTRVGAHSFSCCQGLASLKIPGRLPHIEDFAFNGCLSLASVAIPGSVTNISTCAFQGCSSLTNVTMLGERPEAKDDIFKGCGKLKAIHVPANAKSWAGMKDWFGIPLVFDADDAGRQAN